MKPRLRTVITAKTCFFCVVTVVISAGTALMISCSDSSPPEATPNSAYYDSLKTTSYINSPQAQPPANELFLENTKQFLLEPVTAKQASKLAAPQTLAADFTLYTPSGARPTALAKHALAAVVPGAGIPGFKPADIIPQVCSGLSGDTLRQCLDTNNVGMAPPPVHISYHDPQTLFILLGDGTDGQLLAKLQASFKAQVDKTTQNAIATQLNQYISANSSHLGLNLSQQDIYNSSGYAITNAVLTDGSQGDTDNDGVLESHSTLMVEIRKTLNYTRTANDTLDEFIRKYSSSATVPDESYEIILKAYVHLDDLTSFRQTPPSPPQDNMTKEEQLAYYGQVLQARGINHAFDTNVIKKIIATPEVLPWSCTEYSLSFQLSADTIGNVYAPMLEKALASGDTAAVAAIESHIDAQTALITGGGVVETGMQKRAAEVTVMYQVNMPKTAGKAGVSGGYDYAMVDSQGQRIAIYDPATGTIVYARSESKGSPDMDKRVAMTSAGACRDDKDDWAYLPSRARSPRFGRGIQWILTEWLIHNQTGDYKNIHWYQSAWKASTQVAIKAGTFIFTTYIKLQSGAVAPNKGGEAVVYLLEGVLPYFGNVLVNMGDHKHKVAGYSLSGTAFVATFLFEKSAGGATWKAKLGHMAGNAVLGFVIDRTGSGLAQMLDITAVGWQDFSDGSHHGCFKFD